MGLSICHPGTVVVEGKALALFWMEGVRLWSECCLHYNHGFDYRAVALPHRTGFHVCKLPTLKPKAVGHHEKLRPRTRTPTLRTTSRKRLSPVSAAAQQQPLDLTEDNIRLVLADARVEFAQLFDDSIGITGRAHNHLFFFNVIIVIVMLACLWFLYSGCDYGFQDKLNLPN